jgi:hypothetical protein
LPLGAAFLADLSLTEHGDMADWWHLLAGCCSCHKPFYPLAPPFTRPPRVNHAHLSCGVPLRYKSRTWCKLRLGLGKEQKKANMDAKEGGSQLLV